MIFRTLIFLAFLVSLIPIHARAAIPAEAIKRIESALPDMKSSKKPKKLLVFTLAKGFVHRSIPYGAEALKRMGEKTGFFRVTISNDPEVFEPKNLNKFDAVFMVNTTGNLFDSPTAKQALLDFVAKGKGLAGLHAASDCFYEWPQYGELIGAYFNAHPWHEKVTINVEEPSHPLLSGFSSDTFEITDEIYQFKDPYSRDKLKVLLSLDISRTNMAKQGIHRKDGDFAVSWIREYGKGRVFYSSLGHRAEIYWNPEVLKHYLQGIRYVLGDLDADAKPRPQKRVPTDRFMGAYKSSNGSAADVVPLGQGKYLVRIQASDSKESTFVNGQVLDKELLVGDSDQLGIRIKNWELAGPFQKFEVGGQELLHQKLGPELNWKKWKSWRALEKPLEGSSGAVVNLRKEIDLEHAVVYLRTRFRSKQAQKAVLELGSDDGIKVWVNGKLVHTNDVIRGLTSDQDQVKVNLKSGLNEVILKINQGVGGWGATAKLSGTDGGRPKGISMDASSSGTGSKISGSVRDGVFTMVSAAKEKQVMKRVDRVSPTLGQKPPSGARVLLAQGEGPPSLKAWNNQNWERLAGGVIRVGKGDLKSRRSFGDIQLHLEFMTPYMGWAWGQGRGNSGVYFQDRYEVQILDSFGLIPQMGDCGSIYGVAVTAKNVCRPPEQWQTYDITFRAPRFSQKLMTEAPRVTVRHNGILIHEDQEIPGPTGAGASGNVPKAPLRLQDHGNPVKFRNIWVLEN